jgi:hypothetical protein
MTGSMVVDGAAQHGSSITGTLLILVLFTAYFLLMFECRISNQDGQPPFWSCAANVDLEPQIGEDLGQ